MYCLEFQVSRQKAFGTILHRSPIANCHLTMWDNVDDDDAADDDDKDDAHSHDTTHNSMF